MSFQWDDRKAMVNIVKHGIDFADVIGVFDDEDALWQLDEHSQEERHLILSLDLKGRVVVVVFTFRGQMIRLISARKASRHEQYQYEKRR
ncbi:MAG: BrnT family toxin [Anaerolineales bacterium]|nr:BrnT family toxin [Anaerolineales bacterium]